MWTQVRPVQQRRCDRHPISCMPEVSRFTLTPSESKLLLCHRMHGEALRDGSTLGRFPSVTLGVVDGAEVEATEPEESGESESACRRWLRKICPCCHPKPDDDSEDALVTEIDDDEQEGEPKPEKPEKPEKPDKPEKPEKPETGGSELEGQRSQVSQ